MTKTIKLVTMVVMFVLIALVVSFMPVVHVYATTYADSAGRALDNDTIVYVKNMTKLPSGMPSLDEYREFAKKFYAGQCYTYKEVFRGVYEKAPVDIDMVVFLIYTTRELYGSVGYVLNFVLVYDPMTRKLLWAYLNDSSVYGYFMILGNDVLAYELSKSFPPAGFFLWYVKVDENAWRNGWFVISTWYYRYNATHIYADYNRWVYCPIPQNFTWEMLFEPSTVTYTMPVTITLPVTVTETATTTLPVTVTQVVTATSTTTVERTVTTPTTIRETVTRVETLTVEKTATTTMSYTITMPVTTTATTTAVETTTQVVKELDTMSLVIASGLATAMGIAIGLVVRRR